MASIFRKFKRSSDTYQDLGDDLGNHGNTSKYGSRDGAALPIELRGDYTLQQIIDYLGFGKFQIKLSVLTGLAWMADSMEMMILSILSPALHCDWKLEPWQKALVTTVVFGGMMLSSSLWGTVCDRYGRKVELILCSAFTFYYGLISSFAPNFVWMLILRGLVGFGIGGAPQSVTLYAEFLPTKSRAKCVVLIECFWAIGACFEVMLALLVMPTLGWRYLLAFSSIPLLIFTIACVWLPESARYDLTCGKMDRAMATLKRIAKDNNKPMPSGCLVEIVTGTDQKVKRGRISDLFVPELRVTTLLLWLIWLSNAFAYYGIVLMTTELFEYGSSCSGNENGGKPNPACMLECKPLTTKDYGDLMWTTLAEFPGLFITVLIIDKIGRKKTMAGEFLVFSLFVLLVNICTTRPVLTLFLFISRAFIAGAFQAAYVYTPEVNALNANNNANEALYCAASTVFTGCSTITSLPLASVYNSREVYPTQMRAIGLGTCSGMARVGAIVTPFVAQVLLEISPHLAISTYGTVCLFAAVAACLLPLETKGREMKDTSDQH